MLSQGGEPKAPLALDSVDPGSQFAERRQLGSVARFASDALGAGHANLGELLQMLGDGLTGDRAVGRQAGCRHGTVLGQLLINSTPGRVTKRRKDIARHVQQRCPATAAQLGASLSATRASRHCQSTERPPATTR